MPNEQALEISATSPVSFDDAMRAGLARAARRVHVRQAWVREQTIEMADGLQHYRVSLHVTYD